MSDAAPRRWLALALIGAAATLAYAPSFGVPFQFDDSARLGQNWSLQQGNDVLEALLWLGVSRLVPALTFIANYQIGGFDPFGYHVVNFAVHLLTTYAVFALALALCRTPRLRLGWPPRRAQTLATAAALLFACHPLQTQAVTYVIQRYAAMAALFYVVAVLCYLRARSRAAGLEAGRPLPYAVAAVLAAACAALSKENAASLPAALLLAEWAGFGFPRSRRAVVAGAVVLALLLAIPFAWRWVFPLPTATDPASTVMAPPPRDPALTPLTYAMTQAVVLPRYLRLTLLPWGQNVDHDVPLVTAPTARVAAGAALLLALAVFGVVQLRRNPLLGFAIGWFFVAHSVESSLVPISDVMAEHRMYLPMVGVALAGGWLYAAAAARAPLAAGVAGALVLAALLSLTVARNIVWRSPLTLWLDAVEKSPGKHRPHVNLGVVYIAADRLDDAAREFCRALAIAPDDSVASDNLALVLEAQYGALENADPASYCVEILPHR